MRSTRDTKKLRAFQVTVDKTSLLMTSWLQIFSPSKSNQSKEKKLCPKSKSRNTAECKTKYKGKWLRSRKAKKVSTTISIKSFTLKVPPSKHSRKWLSLKAILKKFSSSHNCSQFIHKPKIWLNKTLYTFCKERSWKWLTKL